jgi:hypothetical protein
MPGDRDRGPMTLQAQDVGESRRGVLVVLNDEHRQARDDVLALARPLRLSRVLRRSESR